MSMGMKIMMSLMKIQMMNTMMPHFVKHMSHVVCHMKKKQEKKDVHQNTHNKKKGETNKRANSNTEDNTNDQEHAHSEPNTENDNDEEQTQSESPKANWDWLKLSKMMGVIILVGCSIGFIVLLIQNLIITVTNNAFLPNATPLSVTVAVGPKNKEKSVRSVIGEPNILLASISLTVQGFPLPVMKGCVNFLRTLHERWKANEPTDLLDNGDILTFWSKDTAEVFPFSSATEKGICRKCKRKIKC